MRVTFGSIFRNGRIDSNRTTEELGIRQREVQTGDMAGIELARLPEDARRAESISAMTQADAAHRAFPGAVAHPGRVSPMDSLT